ncbi:MAG TPA: hypothetical protein VK157_03410 [Phycisphaerales bacterium]|nr:hypothetical protein [Phycisphaerales bacterium]
MLADEPPPSSSVSPPAAVPATLYDSEGTAFAPKCLDCSYALVGVTTSRCPECGLAFTLEKLSRHADAVRASREDRANVIRGLLTPLIVLASVLGLSIDTPLTAVAYILAMAAVIALQYWLLRHVLAAQAWIWLLPLVPLTTLGLGMLTAQHPAPWLLAFAAIAVYFAVLALRGSPLVSAVLLLCVYVAPVLLVSIVIFVHSNGRLNDGYYWTEFNRPTPTGWKALPAPNGKAASVWMALGAVAVGAAVPAYARRAMVRLNRVRKR